MNKADGSGRKTQAPFVKLMKNIRRSNMKSDENLVIMHRKLAYTLLKHLESHPDSLTRDRQYYATLILKKKKGSFQKTAQSLKGTCMKYNSKTVIDLC